MASVVSVIATNNAEIDGLLGGTKWSGTITYSFPTSQAITPLVMAMAKPMIRVLRLFLRPFNSRSNMPSG